MAAALHPRRDVERLPDGHLRDVAAVLVHVRRCPRHHELAEVIPIVRDVAADLQDGSVESYGLAEVLSNILPSNLWTVRNMAPTC